MKSLLDIAISQTDIDSALNTLNAEELRALYLERIDYANPQYATELSASLIETAATHHAEWQPTPPTELEIDLIVTFVHTAALSGTADPLQYDACLIVAARAFYSGNFRLAAMLYRRLLIPLFEIPINLGYDELPDEVLISDLDICTLRYIVSLYQTTASDDRSTVIANAIKATAQIMRPDEQLNRLHEVALEPLPDFDEFIQNWNRQFGAVSKPSNTHPWKSRSD